MRRSTRTRTRTRATDQEAVESGSSTKTQKPTPQTHPTKRARVDTATAEATNEWLHKVLPEAKRSAWDAFMKKHFYLEKPHELYDVFELAAHLCPDRPQDAFLSTAGVRLIGPLDVLSCGGSVQTTHPLWLHGRFFLDPSEVVTIAVDVESNSGGHWGVYRDKPAESPRYIVHSKDASICSFDPVALGFLYVLHDRIEERVTATPDKQLATTQLRLIADYIKRKCGGCARTPASVRSQRMNETLAGSLHGMGIVVPYDAKRRSGFRDLPIAGPQLRDLLSQVHAGDASARKKVTNLVTRATIANDECDFGTSLLLGLDLFTAGEVLQKEALQMLRVAYMLLGRNEFARVASDHIKHRSLAQEPLCCVIRPTDDGASASVTRVDVP